MDDNPFAPPTSSAEPSEGGGLVFSEEGVRVVSSLAAWMRGLSMLLYLFVALLVVVTCAAVATGPRGTGPVVIGMLIALIGVIAAAVWLRSAASGFERGVLSDDEMTIGQGFRSLRAYLILMGILSIVSLGSTISNAME